MLKKSLFFAALMVFSVSSAFAAPKKLVVAHDATWPPMEYIDANKQIVGYSVDYIDALAKELGVEVEHKNVSWDGIFAGLDAKRYDVIASSVTITDERKKNMTFTEPYYEVKQAVLVPKDSPIKGYADLSGKTLGAQMGTTGFFAVKRVEKANGKPFDDITLAVEDLYNGRLDGVVCDEPVAADFATNKEPYSTKFKVAFIIDSAEKEYYGFVVAKENTELCEFLNKGIKQVKEKGIEAQLRKKWFGN